MPTIEIRRIDVRGRLRDLQPAKVDAIRDSIKEVGLINPITVVARRLMIDDILDDGYVLVAGLHRLEAHKALKLDQIDANIVDADELHRRLVEVDENLCRADPKGAELAALRKEQKQLYETLHPETKRGGDRRSSNGQNVHLKNESFAADVAAKTGKSERTVRREIERAENVVVLEEVKGTCLDKAGQLDALAKMPAAQQRELAARAKSGEKVSARDVLSAQQVVDKQVKSLVSAWNKAGPEAREQFREFIDRPVMDKARGWS